MNTHFDFMILGLTRKLEIKVKPGKLIMAVFSAYIDH